MCPSEPRQASFDQILYEYILYTFYFILVIFPGSQNHFI